ncbi:Asp-tRNA(Asn)/Glu-tRNA(Gln) amidotransferase subunit GatB [Desulfothermus okinawensis JCM 13304]
MSKYEVVIGLEVHAQLKTKSKLFCSCPTTFGEPPNQNTCPVCAAMPGALPVVNKKAVEYATKMALAVNCKINKNSLFARKNYFYPDLPKGYQISQYEEPLAVDGYIDLRLEQGTKRVRIVRIHMEDDAGKSIHVPGENKTLIDLNRTGVPLIEIVSAPDINSPEEAVLYLKELRSILVYLDICDGNMQEGSFRCDANVSIRPRGEEKLGTRTELKNMNSFRHVQKALEYEVRRQIDLVEDGEKVIQETRLYDESKGITRSMRGKEEAHDYRYFPDPDLVPVMILDEELNQWKGEIPELPLEKLDRFVKEYHLSENEADLIVSDKHLADYFEEVVEIYNSPKEVYNWFQTDLLRELNEKNLKPQEITLTPYNFANLLKLVKDGKISLKIAKDVFPDIFDKNLDPNKYIEEKGLIQISDDSQLEKIVEEVIKENPKEVEAYKNGKKKLMSFFMGQVMKKTKGKANPKVVSKLFAKRLNN